MHTATLAFGHSQLASQVPSSQTRFPESFQRSMLMHDDDECCSTDLPASPSPYPYSPSPSLADWNERRSRSRSRSPPLRFRRNSVMRLENILNDISFSYTPVGARSRSLDARPAASATTDDSPATPLELDRIEAEVSKFVLSFFNIPLFANQILTWLRTPWGHLSILSSQSERRIQPHRSRRQTRPPVLALQTAAGRSRRKRSRCIIAQSVTKVSLGMSFYTCRTLPHSFTSHSPSGLRTHMNMHTKEKRPSMRYFPHDRTLKQP